MSVQLNTHLRASIATESSRAFVCTSSFKGTYPFRVGSKEPPPKSPFPRGAYTFELHLSRFQFRPLGSDFGSSSAFEGYTFRGVSEVLRTPCWVPCMDAGCQTTTSLKNGFPPVMFDV